MDDEDEDEDEEEDEEKENVYCYSPRCTPIRTSWYKRQVPERNIKVDPELYLSFWKRKKDKDIFRYLRKELIPIRLTETD